MTEEIGLTEEGVTVRTWITPFCSAPLIANPIFSESKGRLQKMIYWYPLTDDENGTVGKMRYSLGDGTEEKRLHATQSTTTDDQ